jgi:class 3 adenylate cyclase
VEPQIRYARTRDGVSIAWYAVGQGLPLLWTTSGPYTNIQREWEIPETRELLQSIADRAVLMRYDCRGFSLSDRDVTDLSLEAMVLDLEAVVDASGFDRLAIMTPWVFSVPALVYAARHPERVGALALTGGTARGRDMAAGTEHDRTMAIARSDWDLATRLLGNTGRAWMMTATVDELRDMLDRSTTQEMYLRWHEAVLDWDATDILPHVTAPALVTHDGSTAWAPLEASRRLAAALPDGRFARPVSRDDAFRAVGEFFADVLARSAAPEPAPAPPPARATRTMLFTDLVGHTDMMRRLGDDRGRAVLREHERITRDTLALHGGEEVKTMGDGFMAAFASATSAVECAIELQRAFAARSEAAAGEAGAEPLEVRVGLNAGEPIAEDGDLFGAAVIMASRVAALAGPGEILVPEPVRHLLAGKEFVFADRGASLLKGFEDAVRIFEVRWRE